jgi:hypothetical protein
MDNSNRIVTKIPLSEIWKCDQDIVSNRKHYLNEEEINKILKISKVDFILADVGLHLHWVGTELCFDIWNNEIKNHLANYNEHIILENFPDNYAYLASEWTSKSHIPIILLEKIH